MVFKLFSGSPDKAREHGSASESRSDGPTCAICAAWNEAGRNGERSDSASARRVSGYFRRLAGEDPGGDCPPPSCVDMAWAITWLMQLVVKDVCEDGDAEARVRANEALEVAADLLGYIASSRAA